MKATVVDLRYNMKEVLSALDRRESVEILYHGKKRGTIIPFSSNSSDKKVEDHSFFGLMKKDSDDVDKIMDELRGGRYCDL